MTRSQEGLLSLMLEIDELCKANDIEYFLGGGCLVGAIRNGGFLPWDDDADIHMTRENADKFYSIRDQFPENRAMLTIKDYPNYLFPGVYRYVDTNTTVQTSRQILLGQPTGQFIDIIIFEEASGDERKQQKQHNAMDFYLELHTKNGTINPKKPAGYYRKYFFLKKLCEMGFDKKIKEHYRKRLVGATPEADGCYLIGTGFAPKPFIPKEYIHPLTVAPFEGYMLPVPERSEEWLRFAYGNDWMYAPPVQEENVHYFLMDIDIPYTVIDKDHERFISGKEHWDICCDDKTAWLKTQPKRRIVNKEIRQTRGVVSRLLLRNTIKNRFDSIEELEELDKKALYNLFKEYYNYQFASATKYWGIFEPLDDELLYYAMFAMVENADYSKCKKLIDMRREHSATPLPERMEVLDRRCIAIQECVDLFYVDKDYAGCREHLDECMKEYTDDINLLRLHVKLLNMKAEEENDFTELNEEVERVLGLYPDDGEFIFFKARDYERKGYVVSARNEYRKAYDNTRNGFVLAESNLKIEELNGIIKKYQPEITADPGTVMAKEEEAERKAFIEECLNLYYIEDDNEACRKMLDEGLERYKDDINLLRLDLRLDWAEAGKSRPSGLFKEKTAALLKRYPDDPNVLVYRGLIRRSEGDYAGALADFEKVVGESDNIFDAYTARTQIQRINDQIEAYRPDTGYFRMLYETKQESEELEESFEEDRAVVGKEPAAAAKGVAAVAGVMAAEDVFKALQGDELEAVLAADEYENENAEDENTEVNSEDREDIGKDYTENENLEMDDEDDAEEDDISDEEIEQMFSDRASLINEIIDLCYLKDDKAGAREKIDEGLSLYPDDRYIASADLVMRSRHGEKAAALLEDAERLLELYPDEGEFTVYESDRLYEEGDIFNARRAYRTDILKSRNPVVNARINGNINKITEDISSFVPKILYRPAGADSDEKYEYIKSCVEHYYLTDEDELSLEMVEEGLRRYPAEQDLVRLRIRLLRRKAEEEENFEPFYEALQQAMERFPEDGSLIIYDAAKIRNFGDMKAAYIRYGEVFGRTDNIYDIDTAGFRRESILSILERYKPKNGYYRSLYMKEKILEGAPEFECFYELTDDEIIADDRLEEVYEERKSVIDGCLDLFYVENDMAACREAVDRGLKVYPDDIYLLRLKFKLDYPCIKGDGQAEREFYEELDRALGLYPEDGELIYYLALKAAEDGDADKALELYEKTLENFRNGYELNIVKNEKEELEAQLGRAGEISGEQKSDEAAGMADVSAFSEDLRKIYPYDGKDLLERAKAAILEEDNAAARRIYRYIKNSMVDAGLKEYTDARLRELKDMEFKAGQQLRQGEIEYISKRRNIYITLIKEIDSLCRENDIKYFLVDDALRLLLRGKPVKNNLREVSMIMLKDEYDRFKKAFAEKGLANRALEGIDVNSENPGYYFRYVATNTLFTNVSFLKAFKERGYCVNIYIPVEEQKNAAEARKIALNESMLRSSIYNIYYEKIRRIESLGVRGYKRLVGKKGYSRRMYNAFNKMSLRDTSKKSHIRFLDGTTVRFAENTFAEPVDMELGGMNLMTVADLDAYMMARYEYHAAEAIRRSSMRVGYDFFAFTGIKYEDFYRECEKEGFLTDRFYKDRQKHMALVRVFKEYEKEKQANINIWMRDGERFKLWKYYMPKKEEIKKLYENEEYEELRRLLLHYIRAMLKYRRKKLGLCFDREIFEITMDVIDKSEKVDVAEWEFEQLREYVPEEHLNEDLGAFIAANAPEGYEYVIRDIEWKDLD